MGVLQQFQGVLSWFQDTGEVLIAVTSFLGTLLLLIKQIDKIKKLLPSTWKSFISLLVQRLVYMLSLVTPLAVLVWRFMYVAGLNVGRLSDPLVFYLLVAEQTVLISLYIYAWSKWISPRLKTLNQSLHGESKQI